jgi:DDE superfamily endonuclease
MPEDTTSPAVTACHSPLLGALAAVVAAHRPAVRQERCFARLRALVWARLSTLGRPTITALVSTLGLRDADWSAFYRLFSHGRVDYAELTRCFVRQTLAQVPAGGPYVVAVDGVQVPRCSTRMPGTAWLKNPRTPPWKVGIHRAQRFVHLAALLPRWAGYSRALPLRFVPAFPPKAVPGAAEPCTEWRAGLAQLAWLRAELDAAGRAEQAVLALGDGSYDVTTLWTHLPERTMLLVRTARNRALWALPAPRAPGTKGRRPSYGDKARTPQEWLHERAGWRHTPVQVRGRTIPLTYRVEGPVLRRGASKQPLFLLVVKGIDQGRGTHHRRRRDPHFFLVTAVLNDGVWVLPLPAAELLAWAWQRWEVEVCHREMKSGAGVGAVQCWNTRATVAAVQVAVWTYALLVLAGYRAWG